jgi:hypothetical protein
MNEFAFPSGEGWPLTLKFFAIPLLPYIPTGDDHNLHEERL